MTNRHKKIVLGAEEGITFEVSEAGEELVSRDQNIDRSIVQDNVCHKLTTVLAGQYAEQLSVYTDKDGNQAVVLPGWTVSGLSHENTIWGKGVSLVIYRIPKQTGSINWEDPNKLERLKKNYSQLVWVPVGHLTPNGTLDGEQFMEKFGRRNYRNNYFSSDGFYEPLEGGLLKQSESVSQYGGFYISRYDVSESQEGNPQSVKGTRPWVNIDCYKAKKVAATFERSGVAQSQLTYGAEEDSMLEWLIESGCKTHKDISEDSTSWGNYCNTKEATQVVVETGSNEEWCANNIYDVAGNVDEWTQEKYESLFCVFRGGVCVIGGDNFPAAYRGEDYGRNKYSYTGFRLTVYIK